MNALFTKVKWVWDLPFKWFKVGFQYITMSIVIWTIANLKKTKRVQAPLEGERILLKTGFEPVTPGS